LVFSYGSRAADVSRAADGGFGVEPARLTAFTGMTALGASLPLDATATNDEVCPIPAVRDSCGDRLSWGKTSSFVAVASNGRERRNRPSSPARSRGRIRLFSDILTASLSVELLQIEEGGR